MTDATTLAPDQYHALFDILTHRESYQEIENFKHAEAITQYGPPFQDSASITSDSPILQSLLAKFILNLPGLRDVSPKFWTEYVEKLLQDLADAELSESYDKGAVGIRKTLATAVAALIEYPARGSLGGFVKREVDLHRTYDTKNADDVLQAWQDGTQLVVYGDLIERIFVKVAETQDLAAHDSLTQAVHEFILVNVASLMHFTVVLSPEGPTILRLMENVHKLIPYILVRQTLKVGNVATMISGMMRIALAKVSVASVTNWIGLSSGADEGMNLMQQIISQVLYWDRREFKKRADKIEKERDAPPKEVRDELRAWISRSRAEHDETRRRSRESDMSLVAVILAFSPLSPDLTETQHAKAAEYLSLHLSVRDRLEIVRVLCHSNPDLLTAAVKTAVDAYTPMIRHIHQAVDLSDSVSDFERFVNDLLKTARPTSPSRNSEPPTPAVEDFVDLLHRHQSSLHKFLHQVAHNGSELTSWWRGWVDRAVAQFRNDVPPPPSASLVTDDLVMHGISDCLRAAFAALSAPDRDAIRAELGEYQQYMSDLHAASASRIRSVINRDRSAPFGPGAYLARWQQLMDATPITPATAEGSVRYGAEQSVRDQNRTLADGSDPTSAAQNRGQTAAAERLLQPPKCEVTVRLLGEEFRAILASRDARAGKS